MGLPGQNIRVWVIINKEIYVQCSGFWEAQDQCACRLVCGEGLLSGSQMSFHCVLLWAFFIKALTPFTAKCSASQGNHMLQYMSLVKHIQAIAPLSTWQLLTIPALAPDLRWYFSWLILIHFLFSLLGFPDSLLADSALPEGLKSINQSYSNIK